MPGLNRQGPPFGDGNQSGRRMGKCNPENKDASANQIGMGRRWRNQTEAPKENESQGQEFRGRGLGHGRGLNRGMGRGFGQGFRQGFGQGFGRGAGRNQNASQD